MSKSLKLNLIMMGIAGLIIAGVFYKSPTLEVKAQTIGSYYQGIVFGTPMSRTLTPTCSQYPSSEGCSSKPYFYCSPWVNSYGVFIDSPSGTTNVNYQGNYNTGTEALDASVASLKNCLKTHNYGKMVTFTSDPDSAFYAGSLASGLHQGSANTNPKCLLGNYLSHPDYWLYKGNITAGLYPMNDRCGYDGVFEEIQWQYTNPANLLWNKLTMRSYDCTPERSSGYKPSASECNNLKQELYLFQEVKPSACTASSYTYSAWGACQTDGYPDGYQYRTVTNTPNCSGGVSPILKQGCTYIPQIPSCLASSYTYSAWGTCQSDSKQYHTVTNTPNCIGGVSPTQSQDCVYVPSKGAVIGTYGVSVNSSTLELTGYAWSDNIGWIKFGGLSGWPTAIVAPGTASQNAQIIEKGTGYKLIGWARACVGTKNGDCSSMENRTDGWDGWINLGGNDVSYGLNYGVIINSDNKNFSGYAWGSEVPGWTDFSKVTLSEALPAINPIINVKLEATSYSISYDGSTTISWSSIGASTCTTTKIAEGASLETFSIATSSSGISSGKLRANTNFIINCKSVTGTTFSDSKTITVIALPPPPPPPPPAGQNCTGSGCQCAGFEYSEWAPKLCPIDGKRYRDFIGVPTDCSGGDPKTTQDCTFGTLPCESYVYSDWEGCVSGVQKRDVASSIPSECTGGVDPELSQSCGASAVTSTCISDGVIYNGKMATWTVAVKPSQAVIGGISWSGTDIPDTFILGNLGLNIHHIYDFIGPISINAKVTGTIKGVDGLNYSFVSPCSTSTVVRGTGGGGSAI